MRTANTPSENALTRSGVALRRPVTSIPATGTSLDLAALENQPNSPLARATEQDRPTTIIEGVDRYHRALRSQHPSETVELRRAICFPPARPPRAPCSKRPRSHPARAPP